MRTYVILISLVMLVIIGCSGGSGNPTEPQNNGLSKNVSSDTNRCLWGIWEVSINTTSGHAEISSLRTAAMTANVNSLLEGNPGNLRISDIDLDDFMLDGSLNCTISLKHPLPGQGIYNGFDVWGVFMHNGQEALEYDHLNYPTSDPRNGDEAVLLNADGYTRWFNRPEFFGVFPILEYTTGRLSSLQMPTAKLNGYKIFADGFGEDDGYYEWITSIHSDGSRGVFRAGSTNARRYELRFGGGVAEFQYAVVASWEPGDPTLVGNPMEFDPGDFPTSANCEESFFINVSTAASDIYYAGGSDLGGTFRADLEVFDWQGGSIGGNGVLNEVGRMLIEGDFLPGGAHEWAQPELAAIAAAGTENSSVFQVEIADCNPFASGEAEFWVITESAGLWSTYDQGYASRFPDAARAAFQRGSVLVSNESLANPTIDLTSPDGGETWAVASTYNVEWATTDNSGQILLEYSKDGFVSDVNEIAAATDDDGVYEWTIPVDLSDTVSVRATLVDDPSVWDESDADFSIIPPELILDAVRSEYWPDVSDDPQTFIQWISLDWDEIPGAEQYAVYRASPFEPSYSWVEVYNVMAGTTNWINSTGGAFGIDWDGDYIYEVRARSEAGNPVSEFISTQRGLVVMESRDGGDPVTNPEWEWRWGVEDFHITWLNNYGSDEPPPGHSLAFSFSGGVDDGWGIAFCPSAIPDLEHQSNAFFDFAFRMMDNIDTNTGWATGTMSVLPSGGEPNYYDFNPAPSSGHLEGESYNSAFSESTFDFYFGEEEEAFTGNYEPYTLYQASRYSIPDLLEPGRDYVGMGIAAHSSDKLWGMLCTDSYAIVVY